MEDQKQQKSFEEKGQIAIDKVRRTIQRCQSALIEFLNQEQSAERNQKISEILNVFEEQKRIYEALEYTCK